VSRKSYGFEIDVFSYCNLRCPSCLVGMGFGDISAWRHSLMPPSLLERILDKALSECEVGWVALYNWTEPLLHPEIIRLIGAVKSRSLPCLVSTNLNVLRNPDELVSRGLDFLRVSLSGFTQDVYQRYHRGGEIDVVKANMRRLSTAVKATGSTTLVQVFYHLYRYNQHEVPAMKLFAEDLGFKFEAAFAYVTVVEKIIEIIKGNVTKADSELLEGLAIPLDSAIALTSQTKKTTCGLREDIIPLDTKGNMMLCTGSSMMPQNIIGNFLDHSIEELQKKRRCMTLCGPCLDLGIEGYLRGQQKFESLARSS
jgi:pyruvate-formate lyase-activating enzyme